MTTGIEAIVSNEAIESAFNGTNFGNAVSRRDIVKYALLKYASVYSTGHTAMCILIELGLLSAKTRTLTRKGKLYLYEVFSNGISL